MQRDRVGQLDGFTLVEAQRPPELHPTVDGGDRRTGCDEGEPALARFHFRRAGGGVLAQFPLSGSGEPRFDLLQGRELGDQSHLHFRADGVREVGGDRQCVLYGAVADHSSAEDAHFRIGQLIVDGTQDAAEDDLRGVARRDGDPLRRDPAVGERDLPDLTRVTVVDPVDRARSEVAAVGGPHLRRRPQGDHGVVEQRLARMLGDC